MAGPNISGREMQAHFVHSCQITVYFSSDTALHIIVINNSSQASLGPKDTPWQKFLQAILGALKGSNLFCIHQKWAE